MILWAMGGTFCSTEEPSVPLIDTGYTMFSLLDNVFFQAGRVVLVCPAVCTHIFNLLFLFYPWYKYIFRFRYVFVSLPYAEVSKLIMRHERQRPGPGVRRYFDPPIYWPRGQYIVRYFDPGVNISLRYFDPPHDILTPLPIGYETVLLVMDNY